MALLLWLGLVAAFPCAGQVNVLPDTTRTRPLPPQPAAPPPSYWVDLERNATRLATPKAVEALLDSVADAGFRRVIVGLKARDGSVAFATRRAPRHATPFDYYETFRRGGEKRHLEIVPQVSVLVEGDTHTKKGLAYDRPEWQTWSRASDSDDTLFPQSKLPAPGAMIFLNAAVPEVQQYEVSVLQDLLENLKPTALLLDEARYPSLEADLGDSSRVRFERWIGLSKGEWPASVINMESPRYGLWRTFRVGIIKEFLARIYDMRARVAPATRLYLAVPGLYETGINVGLNWAHPDYKPGVFYADDNFRRKGVAPMFDEYCIVNRDSNPRAVAEVMRAVRQVTRNSLPNAMMVAPELFAQRPGRFREVLQTILGGGHGLVVNDAGALGGLGYWDIVREELAAAAAGKGTGR